MDSDNSPPMDAALPQRRSRLTTAAFVVSAIAGLLVVLLWASFYHYAGDNDAIPVLGRGGALIASASLFPLTLIGFGLAVAGCALRPRQWVGWVALVAITVPLALMRLLWLIP